MTEDVASGWAHDVRNYAGDWAQSSIPLTLNSLLQIMLHLPLNVSSRTLQAGLLPHIEIPPNTNSIINPKARVNARTLKCTTCSKHVFYPLPGGKFFDGLTQRVSCVCTDP